MKVSLNDDKEPQYYNDELMSESTTQSLPSFNSQKKILNDGLNDVQGTV